MNILTIDQLKNQVPAAFALEPADKVSHRYSFIPTEPIINELALRGWVPTSAQQSRLVQDPLHAMHMITFSQPVGDFNVGDIMPQINLFNAHDASHRFTLRAGMFRKVCNNGMVISIGVGDAEVLRIHIDGASVDLEAAFGRTMQTLERAGQVIPQWQSVKLNFVEQNDFASKAVLIRNNNDPYWSKHFDSTEFLTRRRPQDKADDLWTVFNVVQENIMKGGVQGAVRTTKPITQVKEIKRINESLWQLATEYGTLHGVN